VALSSNPTTAKKRKKETYKNEMYKIDIGINP
jgi:hypothetical protein